MNIKVWRPFSIHSCTFSFLLHSCFLQLFICIPDSILAPASWRIWTDTHIPSCRGRCVIFSSPFITLGEQILSGPFGCWWWLMDCTLLSWASPLIKHFTSPDRGDQQIWMVMDLSMRSCLGIYGFHEVCGCIFHLAAIIPTNLMRVVHLAKGFPSIFIHFWCVYPNLEVCGCDFNPIVHASQETWCVCGRE